MVPVAPQARGLAICGLSPVGVVTGTERSAWRQSRRGREAGHLRYVPSGCCDRDSQAMRRDRACPFFRSHVFCPQGASGGGHPDAPQKTGVKRWSKMNRYRLNGIVEYIRMQDEFPFDVLDVEENLDEVLGYFGLYPKLDEAERAELRTALESMAAEAEWIEIARLVSQEQERELNWMDPRAECPEVLLRIHRQAKSVAPGEWLAGLSAK